MTFWKDSLLIGVPKIDNQHKKLIEAIDALAAACKEGKGRATIGDTLNFVLSYTKEHLSDEEKLQAQYNYPNITAHKKAHADFIQTVTAMVSEFEKTGASIALVAKINGTLVNWLVQHITAEDQKLGEFIKNSA